MINRLVNLFLYRLYGRLPSDNSLKAYINKQYNNIERKRAMRLMQIMMDNASKFSTGQE